MTELGLGPRARQRLERREEILSLAMATLLEHGVDGLSMHQLAKAVGFTPGALYRYFDSKDALVAEVALRVLDQLIASFDEVVEATREQPPVARLRQMVAATVAFSREDPQAFGFLLLLIAHPRVLVSAEGAVAAVLAKLQQMAGPVLSALDDAERTDALVSGNSFERALALLAAVTGALQLKKQERHPGLGIDAERLALSLTDSLLLAWGVQGGSS